MFHLSLRLKDEYMVCEILDDLQGYVELHEVASEINRAYLKKVEHIYYKFDHLSKAKEQAALVGYCLCCTHYSNPSLIRPPYLPRNCGHIREVAFGERVKYVH